MRTFSRVRRLRSFRNGPRTCCRARGMPHEKWRRGYPHPAKFRFCSRFSSQLRNACRRRCWREFVSGVWGHVGAQCNPSASQTGGFQGGFAPAWRSGRSQASQSLQNRATTRLDHYAKAVKKVAEWSKLAEWSIRWYVCVGGAVQCTSVRAQRQRVANVGRWFAESLEFFHLESKGESARTIRARVQRGRACQSRMSTELHCEQCQIVARAGGAE